VGLGVAGLGLGVRVQGRGWRFWGLGLGVEELGIRVQDLGCRDWGGGVRFGRAYHHLELQPIEALGRAPLVSHNSGRAPRWNRLEEARRVRGPVDLERVVRGRTWLGKILRNQGAGRRHPACNSVKRLRSTEESDVSTAKKVHPHEHGTVRLSARVLKCDVLKQVWRENGALGQNDLRL